VVGQVFAEGVGIEVPRHGRVFEDALDLGGEEQAPTVPRVDERLDADTIPSEHQAAGTLVENGEGEHPPQPTHTRRTLCFVGSEDDLSV
jgi:hypothetical protein